MISDISFDSRLSLSQDLILPFSHAPIFGEAAQAAEKLQPADQEAPSLYLEARSFIQFVARAAAMRDPLDAMLRTWE